MSKISRPPRAQNDHAWKELLENYLEEFIALFFPTIHAAVDWSQPIVWLNQELRQLDVQTGQSQRGIVDVLARVHLKSGAYRILLLMLELQGKKQLTFERRMFEYFAAISRRTEADVVAAAVLTDLNPRWKPEHYEYHCLGCELTFRFPVCKLTELESQCQSLKSFAAMVVKLQMAGQRLRSRPREMLSQRIRLLREMEQLGWERRKVLSFFRAMGQMMALPRQEVLQFREAVKQFERRRDMRVLSDIEELICEEVTEKIKKELTKQLKQEVKEIQKEVVEKLDKQIQQVKLEWFEKGLLKGEWIGMIISLEDLLSLEPTPREQLEQLTLPQLRSRYNSLRKQFQARMKK